MALNTFRTRKIHKLKHQVLKSNLKDVQPNRYFSQMKKQSNHLRLFSPIEDIASSFMVDLILFASFTFPKRLLMENYKSAGYLDWGNDIKREEHEKPEKLEAEVHLLEGVVVTRKSRLRWCLWCSGFSAWGSITPPIKGSSTLHWWLAVDGATFSGLHFKYSIHAKHGVQNILSEVHIWK